MCPVRVCDIIFFVYQLVCSGYDIQTQTVPRWLLLVGSSMAAAMRIAGIGEGTWSYIWGALLGIVFFLISKYSGEAVGYADSWMIFVLGMYMGIWKLVASLGIAFLVAGIWGAGMMMLKKKKGKETFPFLPFLTVGYLGVIGW